MARILTRKKTVLSHEMTSVAGRRNASLNTLRAFGVEKKHCEVFQEQEFSGDVLLAMDQQSVFLKELELGPIGRRLKTWHKIKALQDQVNKSATPKLTASDAVPPAGSLGSPGTPTSFQNQVASQTLGGRKESPFQNYTQGSPRTSRRPSAASVRELNHSRNVSSIDKTSRSPRPIEDSTHGKQPSFDRSWTMNAATPPPMSAVPPRPAYNHTPSVP